MRGVWRWLKGTGSGFPTPSPTGLALWGHLRSLPGPQFPLLRKGSSSLLPDIMDPPHPFCARTGKLRTRQTQAPRPELPEAQPHLFPILPPSRGHTLHTVLRARARSGGTRAPQMRRDQRQGHRKGDSPAGPRGGCTSRGAGARYHRTPYLVTEAPSLQDPQRSRSALSLPKEERARRPNT